MKGTEQAQHKKKMLSFTPISKSNTSTRYSYEKDRASTTPTKTTTEAAAAKTTAAATNKTPPTTTAQYQHQQSQAVAVCCFAQTTCAYVVLSETHVLLADLDKHYCTTFLYC